MDMAMSSAVMATPLLGAATVCLSGLLFVHAWLTGQRLTSLQHQKEHLEKQRNGLACEVERLQAEVRGLCEWNHR